MVIEAGRPYYGHTTTAMHDNEHSSLPSRPIFKGRLLHSLEKEGGFGNIFKIGPQGEGVYSIGEMCLISCVSVVV